MFKAEYISRIVPDDLAVLRSFRYQGDKMSVSLAELGNEDRVAVQRLYEALKSAQQTLEARAGNGPPSVEVAEEIAGQPIWREMLVAARELDSRKGRHTEAVD